MTTKYDGHTPGPWRTSPHGVCKYANVGADAGGLVAMVYSCVEDEANARLIAAAPDLLRERDDLREALTFVAMFLAGDLNHSDLQAAFRKHGSAEGIARAALARTEPRT